MPLTPHARDIEKEGTSEQSEGAGALGVEITPAMIEAGLIAYMDRDSRFESHEEIVAHIYRAMAARAI